MKRLVALAALLLTSVTFAKPPPQPRPPWEKNPVIVYEIEQIYSNGQQNYNCSVTLNDNKTYPMGTGHYFYDSRDKEWTPAGSSGLWKTTGEVIPWMNEIKKTSSSVETDKSAKLSIYIAIIDYSKNPALEIPVFGTGKRIVTTNMPADRVTLFKNYVTDVLCEFP